MTVPGPWQGNERAHAIARSDWLPGERSQTAVRERAARSDTLESWIDLRTEGARIVVIPLPRQQTWEELRSIFEDLVNRWHNETALEALASRKAMNFAYQSIIGMGPDALPFILQSLTAETDDWYWALTAITRKNVAAGTKTTDDATKAWIEWGKREGYVP
jgi:hypothetical protein